MTNLTRSKLVFIGVSTGGSSIMKIFPQWSDILGLNCDIIGVDLPLRAPAEEYRRVLREVIGDPTVNGALITAHKIDLLSACHDMFDDLDPYAEICDEVSCVVKRGDSVYGCAKDPISSALALEQIVPPRHWHEADRDVLCLGAGGAAIAISVCMAQAKAVDGFPRRFALADVLPERLESIRRIHRRLKISIQFEYHLSRHAAENDALLHDLPTGSLVINATGLGKDKPGSPLTSAALFPPGGLIWELNYRGARDFMRQAAAQADARNLTIADGWIYFLHGWTEAIGEIFDLKLNEATFDQLATAAESFRNPN